MFSAVKEWAADENLVERKNYLNRKSYFLQIFRTVPVKIFFSFHISTIREHG